jgi:Nuclear transport factor 2 (NTF2) domain.
LELFKERKKNRRKERKSTTGTVSSLAADSTDSTVVVAEETGKVAVANPAIESGSTNSSICSGASGKENANHHEQQQKQQRHRPHHHHYQEQQQLQQQQQQQNLNKYLNGHGPGVKEYHVESANNGISTRTEATETALGTNQEFQKTRKKNKNKMKRSLCSNSCQEKDVVTEKETSTGTGEKNMDVPLSPPLTTSKSSQSCNIGNNHSDNDDDNKHEPSLSYTSPPPPGFQAAMSNLKLDKNEESNNVGEPMVEDVAGNFVPGFHPPIHQIMASSQNDLYIVIPDADRPMYSPPPPPPPSYSSGTMPFLSPSLPSLAIPAAKAFVDLYYRHLTMGQYSDLCRYYTPNAQKSISVGGAHSVVATRSDIMLQLQSLSQSIFIVRGVVSQDTQDGRGAHILVTGVVQTGEVLTQFAHSVGLVAAPQHGLFSFQIHNDALSLLTGGDEVVPSRGHDGVRGVDEQSIPPVQNGGGQDIWNGDMSATNGGTATDRLSKSWMQDKNGVSS